MLKKFVCLFLCAAASGLNAKTSVVESNFTETDMPIKSDMRAKNLGYFSGPLPAQWNENFTAWAKAYVRTSLEKSPNGNFLRFSTTKIISGNPQFFLPIPKLRAGRDYNLSALVRNSSKADALLVLRLIEPPYTALHSIDIKPGDSWQNISKTMRIQEDIKFPVGVFIILKGEGDVDFKSVKMDKLPGPNGGNDVLLDVDFTKNTRDRTRSDVGKFRGVLPSAWDQNFTNFMKADTSTEIAEEGGKTFMRFNVHKGAPQFCAQLKNIEAGENYRLTANVRNRTGGAVKMSLRIMPPPYTTLTAGPIQPTEKWTKQTIHFKVPENKPELPVALMMNFEEDGVFEITNMKLEKSEGATEIIRRPAATSRNYFKSTRLPFGLQSGWTLHRNYTYGDVAPAEGIKGPSGEAPLKLQSLPGKKIGICSEPFNVANPKLRNAVSFDYRSDGKYTAQIWTQNRQIASINLPATDSWKRATLPFRAPKDSWALTLRIDGTGTIFLDRFRASKNDGGGYSTDGECEVALSIPKTETSCARIQFTDEAPEVLCRVLGNTDGVKLKAKVVNIYGESKDIPDIEISKADPTARISYLLFPEKPLGQFRVEVQAFKNATAVSPVNEIIVTRLERPRYWGKDAPDSPFGIHVMASNASLKAVKAAGVNWARLHDAGAEYIGWFWLEPEKGKWEFRDDDINAYRKNHLKIFGQFGTAPKWASYLSKVDTGRNYITYHDRYFRPVNMEDFQNYVRTVASRYKGVIDDWFVWNEPWNIEWWAVDFDKNSDRSHGYITSKNPQADFAGIMKAAYEAAKEVNPNAKISGFNTTSGLGGERWTKGVYDAGGLNFCDIVDFHFYTPRTTGYPDDACENSYAEATGYIVKKNGSIGKPVYMSEGQGACTGGASGDDTMRYAGMYKHTLPWNNTENYTILADKTVRYIVSMLSCGVKKVFLYTSHGYGDFSTAPNYLVMFCADGYAHPMLVAHSAMAFRLEGLQFSHRRELTKSLWAYIFSDGKRSVAVISGRREAKGAKLNCSIGGAKVYDLYGNAQKLPATFNSNVCYVEAPVGADKLGESLAAKE